jgi:hypothetical protein
LADRRSEEIRMTTHAFSHASLTKLRDLAARGANRAKKFREDNEEKVGHVIEVVEVAGAAFLAGYGNQRFGTNGEITVAGIPADLGVGALGVASGLFKMLGKYSEHGVHVGSGLLAGYSYRLGASLGGAAKTQGQMTSGDWRMHSNNPGAQVEAAEMG